MAGSPSIAGLASISGSPFSSLAWLLSPARLFNGSLIPGFSMVPVGSGSGFLKKAQKIDLWTKPTDTCQIF